jgi:C_GCAxxG_C_C family probable redox protein
MEQLVEKPVDPGDEAVRLFRSGYSCAEAVVLALAPWYPEGLAEPQRVAAAFGGWIARRGLLCGCVTGSALALGAAMGRTSPTDTESRDRVYAAMDRVLAAFAERFGSLDCRQLTGLDFTREEAREEWGARVQEALCVHLVRAAAQLTAEELRRAVVAAQAQAKAAIDRTP